MKLKAWLILSLIILLTSCATTMQQPKELYIPSQRSIHNGFSLLPPNERGWMVLTQEPLGLILGKRGNDPDESIMITARTVNLPEFKSREEFVGIAKSFSRDSDPTRFHDTTQVTKSIIVDGQPCESIKTFERDIDAHRVTNRKDPMIIEANSLVCPHPQGKIAIIVTYSHRCYPGQSDPEMAKKAEEIFKTVEVED